MRALGVPGGCGCQDGHGPRAGLRFGGGGADPTTMKTFSCGAVVPSCNAVFTGADDDAILTQVAEHATRDHGLETIPDELVSAVRSNIRAA